MTTEAINPQTPYLLDPAFPNLEGMNRQDRANKIANNPKAIRKVKANVWTVKSQNSLSIYTVTKNGDSYTCNCPDCIVNKCECKHILAVKKIVEESAVRVEHNKTHRDWSNYNLGQMKEGEMFDVLLKELSETVCNPIQTRGRKSIEYSDKIFCAVKKVATMKSLRRNQSTFNEAESDGMIEKSLHYNTLSYFFTDARATPVLHELVRLSASPLASIENTFSIDSSGFRTTQFNSWTDEKYGERREHKWLKCHIASGNLTNIISDVIITEQDGEGSGDVNNFANLLEGTAGRFTVKEICADAAYVSRENFAKAEEIDAEPFIYFKKNTNAKAKGCPAWTTAFIKFMTNHEEWMKHYNKRNNVESTFGAFKAKFGEVIKAKDSVAQVNELLCKVLAYNITVLVSAMYAHDVEVKF